jgi:DNA-binding CsgD family transcriptional regulator
VNNKNVDIADLSDVLDRVIVSAYHIVTSNFSWAQWLDQLIEIVGAQEAWIESREAGGEAGRESESVIRMVAHASRPGDRSMEFISCVVARNGADSDVMVLRGRDVQAARPFIEELQPHVARVLQLRRYLDAGRERLKLMATALTDSMSVGVLVLHGSSHMVVSCNAAARHIVGRNNILAIVNGRLVLTRHSEGTRFRDAIESVQNSTNGMGRHVILGTGEHIVSLLCYRLDRFRDSNISEDVREFVAVFISSAEELPAIRSEYLKTEFSLTPKEIRLSLGLAQGRSVEVLATDFHLSRHTLRAQLKSVLRKTGVRSQSGLVRLLLEDPRLLFAPSVHPTQSSLWS